MSVSPGGGGRLGAQPGLACPGNGSGSATGGRARPSPEAGTFHPPRAAPRGGGREGRGTASTRAAPDGGAAPVGAEGTERDRRSHPAPTAAAPAAK